MITHLRSHPHDNLTQQNNMRHLYCLWKHNTLFNITEKNDKLSYILGSGYKTITVSPEAYEISQISSEIAPLMKEQGDEPKILL